MNEEKTAMLTSDTPLQEFVHRCAIERRKIDVRALQLKRDIEGYCEDNEINPSDLTKIINATAKRNEHVLYRKNKGMTELMEMVYVHLADGDDD